MRKFAYLAALAAVAACEPGASDEGDRVPTIGVTSAQLEAFDALEAKTELRWEWLQDEERKTPAHLSAPRLGKAVLANHADPITTTLGVLGEHRALFGMRDPETELASSRLDVDDLGMTHARFQQLTHGIPVAGAEMMVHYDSAGRLTAIDAGYVPDLADVDVNPTLGVVEALTLVKSGIATSETVAEATLEADAGRLVVHAPPAVAARLAWEFRVRALAAPRPAIWVVTIDAKTGAILDRYNDLKTIQGQGVGVLGDAKKFEITPSGVGYVLIDKSTPVEIRTYTANQEHVTPGALVSSTNASSWDTADPGAGAAVDAHVNASIVFRYYKERHGRNGLDDRGSALVSTVHYGQAYENAAWDGYGMYYGDGGSSFHPLSVALDVVAHEFSHGVTEKSSALVYRNQPGALNESVSDIFAAFIEHWVAPDASKNWTIGEKVMKTVGALRDMKDPGAVGDAQPAHMSKYINTQQDDGGIHANSGIMNNAAYLMTVGGMNPISKMEVKGGIGWDKSEKLWYRANTRYFLSTTKFGAAAQGLLQAADDLEFTDAEKLVIKRAFVATGILKADDKELTSGDDTDDAGSGTTSTKRRRMLQSTSGCNAGGSSSGLGFALALALLGIAAGRRSRPAR